MISLKYGFRIPRQDVWSECDSLATLALVGGRPDVRPDLCCYDWGMNSNSMTTIHVEVRACFCLGGGAKNIAVSKSNEDPVPLSGIALAANIFRAILPVGGPGTTPFPSWSVGSGR